jgi:ribosomal protein S18 acetylase RimI-like enzyme
MSTPRYEYTFFRIIKDSAISSSAEKYKQLRLLALSIAPSSFSSTYEIESALTDTEWTTRLAARESETFICAATPIKGNTSDSQSSEQTIWVGQLTLRGPLRREDFILPPASGQKNPMEHEDRELWQMLSLFTLPDHRGRGLGKKLCREALNYLFSNREFPREVWVRLMVKPENHATVNLYRNLGFAESGKCTLAEALVANGDKDLLPKDASAEKYSARSGLIMILTGCRY